ncbi:MAG: hypothetical protein KDD35_07520, partial [Bdellovibrionales bacterium]|nr:hypothetical protein [Bdellovibrionales bacterium]
MKKGIVTTKLRCIILLFMVLPSGLFAPVQSVMAQNSLQLAPTGDTFDLEREFPNYFLPENYSELTTERQKLSLKRARLLLEKALFHLFSRMTIPIALPKTGSIVSVRYFSYLNRESDKITGNQGRIVPSGGVVRTAISYIYNEMYLLKEKDPSVPDVELLEELASGALTYQGMPITSDDIPAFYVRGLGSDVDTLSFRIPIDKQAAVSQMVSDITNSLEKFSQIEAGRSALLRTLFSVADIKDLEQQMGRSIRSGGASIDWVAFDPIEGVFLEPDGARYVIDEMLQGYYRYIKGSEAPENPFKQTVRGFRALLEMPWMTISDSSILSAELSDLEGLIIKRHGIPLHVREQFDKMVRNSRQNAAHNRIWRGAPGSIEAKLRGFLQTIRQSLEITLLPEFTGQVPLDSKSPLKEDFPKSFLVPTSSLEKYKVSENLIYHGTPNQENALAILRGGLFLSGGSNVGTSYVFGRGAYSSPSAKIAYNYAGSEGIAFPLRIRSAARILDWGRAQEAPFFKNLA